MAVASDSTFMPARRGLLRGLVGLPLVGGSVALLGEPTAAAVPVTAELLHSYNAFLHFERQYLRMEMERLLGDAAGSDFILLANPGGRFHRTTDPTRDPQPSTRAAVVLAAAGVVVS